MVSVQNQKHLLLVYFLSLSLVFIGSFFTGYRTWGVNTWGYFPFYVRAALLVIGVIAPFLIGFTKADRMTARENGSDRYVALLALAVAGLLAVAFYLLRAKTHFLGDGYQMISRLGEGDYLKHREFGESLVHVWAKNLLGLSGVEGARASYQTVSIAAGVLFLGLVAVFSRMLFERSGRRWLFFLGLSSGGYMMLFFGYVENYSLFVLSVVLFTLAGLLIAKGRLNRWLILPLLLLAIFFHILGMTLIPGAVYLLVAKTALARRLAKQKAGFRLAGWLLLLAIIASVLTYFYINDYFFRLAFVPVIADRFTIEGYTMFSGKHLLDFLNLLLLLLPALPLFVLVLGSVRIRKIMRAAPYRFLAVLLVSALGAVFVFDPKLGMPRDWDLFAFVGVPMAAGFFYILLDDGVRLGRSPTVALLAVLLGLMSVLPRVAAQASAETSISVIRDYMALDRVKNRHAHFVLARYYADAGDELASALETKRWKEEFPEREMVTLAKKLRAEQKTAEAVAVLRRVIQLNPHDSDAWSNLGEAYMILRMYDSALYVCRIADGLNPNTAPILANLGSANYYLGHLDEAEKTFKKAQWLDSTLFEIPFNLSHVYRDRGDTVRYRQYLQVAAQKKRCSFIVFRELGDVCLRQGDYKEARHAYSTAVARGLDSNYVRRLEKKYPRLRND